MTFDIIIPMWIINYIPLALMWFVFGVAFSFLNLATRRYIPQSCAILGFVESAALVFGVMLLVSVFTGQPFDIQLINITAGATP